MERLRERDWEGRKETIQESQVRRTGRNGWETKPGRKVKDLRDERNEGAPGSRCEENREESGKEEQDAE